jgi:hypothetical protein
MNEEELEEAMDEAATDGDWTLYQDLMTQYQTCYEFAIQ